MKYLLGITLVVLFFSSHAMACEKMNKNKSASVLKLESTKATEVESSSKADKNLIADEGSFQESVNNIVSDANK